VSKYRPATGDGMSANIFLSTTALELDGSEVNRGNFPLPTLGAKLEKLAFELYNGRGFCLVRGLDAKKYSSEDITMIWLGIQSYVGEQLGRQDKNGNMLGESCRHLLRESTAWAPALRALG
jgi:hypothetical protein